MEDPPIPPPTRLPVVRSCETSRLQRQLLARAYQQICPEVRQTLHTAMGVASTPERRAGSSTAARWAAGA
jgi:hypothetical protein